MKIQLRLTGRQHKYLSRHLFPEDGFEAVSIGICGVHTTPGAQVSLLQEIHHIPYGDCQVRTPEQVTWSTSSIVALLQWASKRNLTVIKFHSHPSSNKEFSHLDDKSDREFFSSVYGWTGISHLHASVIVLPDGTMTGRTILPNGQFEPITRIAIAGDDLRFFDRNCSNVVVPYAFDRHSRMFGSGTTKLISRLSAGVVGCSGTGAPSTEMLSRLGFGELVLVDPDRVGIENLNRIPNATMEDVQMRRLKVDVLERAIRAIGLGTTVKTIPENIVTSSRAVKALAGVDVLFGCMDGVEGRHTLNRIAAYYNIPYFDVGVKLLTTDSKSIEEVCGAVHYVQPDGPSLLERNVYSLAQVRAEGMQRIDPCSYQELVRARYIEGVNEPRPAVVTVNTLLASMMLNEFLARLHPYRFECNSEYATLRVSLVQMQSYFEKAGKSCGYFDKFVGRGDVTPLLDMPELSDEMTECAA